MLNEKTVTVPVPVETNERLRERNLWLYAYVELFISSRYPKNVTTTNIEFFYL